jgi:hypothetical protein
MFLNPEIGNQLANEHRRDLLADAQQQSFARRVRAGADTAKGRQPLTYRLWRRLRPVAGSRLEPQV